MNKELKKVKEFQKKFKRWLPKNGELPEPEIVINRHRLIREEFRELQAEMFPSIHANKEKIAKELADLLYVVYGAVLDYGLEDCMSKVFDIVHRSNMSKLGKDGKPVYDEGGKVLKGDGYKPANLVKIIPQAPFQFKDEESIPLWLVKRIKTTNK